jgi:hypothetical protein
MTQRNFIRVYDDVSPSLCQSLISWHDSNIDSRTESSNRTSRKDVQKWLPFESEWWKPLQDAKMQILKKYLDEFPHAYRGMKKLTMPENKIQRTDPFGGGFHSFHSEISHWENCSRCRVGMIYLNDIPEGEGETEWLFENLKVKPKQGRSVIWPAAWMYQHRGNPIHTKSKYIATGWYWYPEERFYYK